MVNPIQGCPNRCKYCFLQSVDGTGIRPIEIIKESDVISEIKKSKYYTPSIPLCFFSQTDIFSIPSNVEYLKRLLMLIRKTDIKNPLVFITKCSICDEIIEILQEMILEGFKILFYLSYSGLDSTIEGNIKEETIQNNFIKLSAANIPIIHYFRPLIPLNASRKRIDEIISFVSNYSIASVVAGLKIETAYQEKLDFWPEIVEGEDYTNAECVWPKGVRDVLKEYGLKYDYPIFETNTCALSLALGTEERYGFYNSAPCKCFNNCPKKMREKCEKVSLRNIQRNENDIRTPLIKLLKLIKKEVLDLQIELNDGLLQIKNVPLSNEDICFLSGELHIRINCTEKIMGRYWNTSVNNKTGVEL